MGRSLFTGSQILVSVANFFVDSISIYVRGRRKKLLFLELKVVDIFLKVVANNVKTS